MPEKELIAVYVEGEGYLAKGEVYFVPADSEIGKILTNDEYPNPDTDYKSYQETIEKIKKQAVKSISIEHIFYATI
jgi:hypothetical protein